MDDPITPQGVGGLAGALTLTVSGPGFLAGYGANAFFKLLDQPLARVFSADGPSAAR